MADSRNSPRRFGLVSPTPTGEEQRATTFELLFDLVYVFAVTQVTSYMAHQESPTAVLQGVLILALLWWTWSGYTWLGNQARADEGLMRWALTAATATMFVVALSVPQAWRDPGGGLTGPLVLVCAYLLVRALHLSAYAVAAADDPRLRRQVLITLVPLVSAAALMLSGALLGGWTQTILYAAAVVAEWTGVYVTSRRGAWRIHSAAHWAERHGLFIILAIGESVVAVGEGAADQPIRGPLIVGAVLGVAVAVCLWWLYFDVVSIAAEHRLVDAQPQERVKLAHDAYTYGHFPIVAGIVISALGVHGVLAHAEQVERLGGFYASALFGGVALYLAGHLLFKQRMHSDVSVPRAITMAVMLAALPAAICVPPLACLAGVVVILATLIGVETARHSEMRHQLRGQI
jgi:low temperature requirement protein LtrA